MKTTILAKDRGEENYIPARDFILSMEDAGQSEIESFLRGFHKETKWDVIAVTETTK